MLTVFYFCVLKTLCVLMTFEILNDKDTLMLVIFFTFRYIYYLINLKKINFFIL